MIGPLPILSDFLYPQCAMSVHGLAHETRVLVWTQVLAKRLSLSDADRNTLAWAARLHDTQRWDDGDDPGHGERAALLLEKRTDFLPAEVLTISIPSGCAP